MRSVARNDLIIPKAAARLVRVNDLLERSGEPSMVSLVHILDVHKRVNNFPVAIAFGSDWKNQARHYPSTWEEFFSVLDGIEEQYLI